MTAFHNAMDYSMLSAILRLPSYWKQEKAARKLALELLDVFSLRDMADAPPRASYGAQRKLEIARALATNPKVLLLDDGRRHESLRNVRS